MTIKLLVPYNDFPAGARLSRDLVFETRMVAESKASFDLSASFQWPKESADEIIGPFVTTAVLESAYPAIRYPGFAALVGAAAPYAVYFSDGQAWLAKVGGKTNNLTGGIEIVLQTPRTDLSAISTGLETDVEVTPPGASNSLYINRYNRVTLKNAGGDVSGAGHIIEEQSHIVMDSPGRTASLMIAGQDKLDCKAGTITLGCISVSSVNENTGTIGTLIGHRSQITNSIGGTVANFWGYSSLLPASAGGTVGAYVAYHNPVCDLTVTSKRFFLNDDPAMPGVSKAPLIDQSIQAVAPVSGGTTNVDKVSELMLGHGATIATHTFAFPAGREDGHEIRVRTLSAVTAATWTAAGTNGVLNGPAGLAAFSETVFKYYASVDFWIRWVPSI